jgi:hypothetical protein
VTKKRSISLLSSASYPMWALGSGVPEAPGIVMRDPGASDTEDQRRRAVIWWKQFMAKRAGHDGRKD